MSDNRDLFDKSKVAVRVRVLLITAQDSSYNISKSRTFGQEKSRVESYQRFSIR